MDKTTKVLYESIKSHGNILKNFTESISSDEYIVRYMIDDVVKNIYPKLDINIKYIGDNDHIVHISHGKFIKSEFDNRSMTIPLLLNKDINIKLEEVYCKIRGMLAEKMLNNPLLAATIISGVYSSINATVNIYPEPNRFEKLFIKDERHKVQRMYLTELSLCP